MSFDDVAVHALPVFSHGAAVPLNSKRSLLQLWYSIVTAMVPVAGPGYGFELEIPKCIMLLELIDCAQLITQCNQLCSSD